MWPSNKIRNAIRAKSIHYENLLPGEGLISKEQTFQANQAIGDPDPDEIQENFLEEVVGGINPQPLPPRDDKFSVKVLRAS